MTSDPFHSGVVCVVRFVGVVWLFAFAVFFVVSKVAGAVDNCNKRQMQSLSGHH